MPDHGSVRGRRRGGPRFRARSIHQLMYEHRLTERAFARAIGFRRRAVVAWMEGVSPPVEAVAAMMAQFGQPFQFFIENRSPVGQAR